MVVGVTEEQFARADDDGVARLVVTGEIDLLVAEPLQDALEVLVRDAKSRARVDLTRVSFFDSTGIKALLLAEQAARRRGVELVIEPTPDIQRVVGIVGLEQHFRWAIADGNLDEGSDGSGLDEE